MRFILWLREKLFSKTLAELEGAWGRLIRSLRVLWFAAREFLLDYCPERAATMSFVTIISLIPLAVLFASFAVQVGYGDQFIAYAKEKLFPLAAPDFQDKLLVWLQENIAKSAFQQGLGSMVGLIALVSLIISAIAVLNTAERNFNRVWKVQGSRTYIQKLTSFWVILTTSPFILVASAWVGDFLVPKGGIIEELTRRSIIVAAIYGFIVPVTIGFVAFTVLYYYLPSTRVRITSAMAGGLMAAILWELSRRAFYLYVGRSASLYGSLWIVPLFLIWIYLNWFITLWGCEIAYASQNLDHLTELLTKPKVSRQLPPPFLAVYFLERIGAAFLAGEKLPAISSIAEDLGVTAQEMEEVARRLADAGLVIEDLKRPGSYSLATAPERLRVDEVVRLFAGEEIAPESLPALPETDGKAGTAEIPPARRNATLAVFRNARMAYLEAFSGKTIRDLLAEDSAGRTNGEGNLASKPTG